MAKPKKRRSRKIAKWSRSDKLALTMLVLTVALWLLSRLLGG